uniref:Leucine carboxyl methyltransferase 1 n=1 Tax=Wuchereria bancrofti TaxID=6293 RepID=A0AAF5Q6G5_WUCBA
MKNECCYLNSMKNSYVQLSITIFNYKDRKRILLVSGIKNRYLLRNVKTVVFYRYVEADFSSVTAKKIRQMLRPGSPNFVSMFSEEPKEVEHSDLHAGDYHLVGADLRQLNEFKEKLGSCELNYKLPTLFIAECVLVYVETSQSDALLSAASNGLRILFFLNYEQVNIGDTFGKIMCRGIILPGLAACENLDAQKRRFIGSGWKNVIILLSQLLEHYCFVIASKNARAFDFEWKK